jgi:hypothetical protein
MLEFSEPSRGSVIFPSPVDELGPEIDRAAQKHRNRILSYPVYHTWTQTSDNTKEARFKFALYV